MTVVEAFGDVAENLARMDPDKIIDLRASPAIATRAEELVSKKKEGILAEEEAIQLERYLALDLLINLAKARAKGILSA